ncbi:MAG: hypothetical protein GY844_20510 [Bradyrhizobium sp.]|nr:hypothetical protein [Bradyrhizobium sp.]
MPPDRASDDEVFRNLGAAVVLCWTRLPLGVREQILNQAGDVIGLVPVSRKDIVKLLLRHAKAQWATAMQRLR